MEEKVLKRTTTKTPTTNIYTISNRFMTPELLALTSVTVKYRKIKSVSCNLCIESHFIVNKMFRGHLRGKISKYDFITVIKFILEFKHRKH